MVTLRGGSDRWFESIRPTLTTETREGKFPMARHELEERFHVPKYSPKRRRFRESTADDVTR
jgi:hypothetical protein